MVSLDPTSQIQALIDKAATEHIAIVAGLISPDVANSPTLLYAGESTLWNTLHNPLTLTADTPFLLASITKTFTSSVQYLLHSDYDGNLGDFINVPEYPLPSSLSSLPIVDLANYSPGFRTDNKGTWLPKGVADNLESLLKYLSGSNLPQNSPGTCYSYSNFGWAMLGLAALGVTSVSDDVLAAWSKQIYYLTTDFNLNNTQPYDPSIDPNLPVGYRENGHILPVGFSYGMQQPMLFGAGNLASTGNDMLTYLSYSMGISDPTSAMLKMQQSQQYTMPKQCPPDASKKVPTTGLAWFFQTANLNGQQMTWLTKNGGNAGFTSWMGFQQWVETGQASQIGAFVLTNSHQASPLGTAIIKILLGETSQDLDLNPGLDLETQYVTPE